MKSNVRFIKKVTFSIFLLAVLFFTAVLVYKNYKSIFIPKISSTWKQYATPEEVGYSSVKLLEARKYYEQIGTTSFMVVYNGNVLVAWGDIEGNTPCHSIRKSFLSALIGIYVDKKKVDINKSLAELNIDDIPQLTQKEKEAKVSDLLKARSGVYHPAAAEPNDMKDNRPMRGSHEPGSFWFYNNWDFNTLGTIFRKETGEDIFKSFDEQIAKPLGMEDFSLKSTNYGYEKDKSIHPAYKFRMSSRDMARFGQLFLQNGKWSEKQIVSEKWVKESTKAYSETEHFGYGYMWWTMGGKYKELGGYNAEGMYGNRIDILPKSNLVIVHRVNSNIPVWPFMKKVGWFDYEKLLNMVLDAKISEPKNEPKLIPLEVIR